MTLQPSLYAVKAIIVMDVDGKKLLSKYYPALSPITAANSNTSSPLEIQDPKSFEKSLFEKSKKASNEIIIIDGSVVVYKNNADLYFYVVGPLDENEILLQSILNGFYETISLITKTSVDKRSFMENLDTILLALDETIDNGIILDLDSAAIAGRISKRRGSDGISGDIPLSFDEESVQRALNKARDFARNFLK